MWGAKLTSPVVAELHQQVYPYAQPMLLKNGYALGCRIKTTKKDRKEVWGS